MMEESGGEIVLAIAEGVATITIRREHKRNALARRHFIELADLLATADASSAAGVIILTGAGERAFCAGADLTPGERFFDEIGRTATTGLGDVLRCARFLSKPLLGRINGDCYAGGVGLLAACDLAIAVDSARFALPEVKLGLFPFVVVEGLRQKMSAHSISELALTGAPVSADRAERIGLVTRCVSQAHFSASVAELAATLANLPRGAVKAGRPALHAISDQAFEAALAAAEARTRELAERRA